MIDPTTPAFPNNIVNALALRLATVDPTDTTMFKRPLRHTDPSQSIGVFGALWVPEQESLEIGHFPAGEPTLGVYQLGIQFFIKDGDEERGLASHSVFSALGRRVLYRDQQLRILLAALSVSDGTTREAARRWRVVNQRYMNNEIEGTFVYLSTIEFTLDTEILTI